MFFYHPPLMVAIRFSILSISMVIYLVFMNYFGQRIMDKSAQVFHTAYFDSDWYVMPKELRRMILLIMIDSTECRKLTAGKMGEVSLEAAGIVIIKN